jgi:hypothetical protein
MYSTIVSLTEVRGVVLQIGKLVQAVHALFFFFFEDALHLCVSCIDAYIKAYRVGPSTFSCGIKVTSMQRPHREEKGKQKKQWGYVIIFV